jgi:hypothetical protein
VLASDPAIVEEWKWNSPVWSKNGPVCSVSAFKKHVGMNFFRGAYLEDRHSVFNAGLESKHSRSIKFEPDDQVDEEAIRELVRSAVDHNEE